MSDASDQIGLYGFGIPRIMPAAATSARANKRKPDDRGGAGARHLSDHGTHAPPPPGSGTLIDKEV